MQKEKLSHIDFGFKRPLTLREFKNCQEVGDAQFHRFPSESVVTDPFHGQSEEWDRMVAALTELHYLDQRIREEAQAIFVKHGLSDHGFACTVHFHYVPAWDKSEKE